jgi:hypothetical protein
MALQPNREHPVFFAVFFIVQCYLKYDLVIIGVVGVENGICSPWEWTRSEQLEEYDSGLDFIVGKCILQNRTYQTALSARQWSVLTSTLCTS